jgi:hypothetical protein
VMEDKSNQTILLDIYERLGGIEASLKSVEKIETQIEKMETQLEAKIAKLDERTDDLERFESRIAAYIWIGGSIVSGVLFFLWEGLKYFIPKDFFYKLFH